MKVKVALGQMLVEGGKAQNNLQRAAQMIHDAGTQDCHIIVLPECLDLGWTHPSARDMAQPIPGEPSTLLCEAARESGVYVAAGLTERAGELIYNSAVLISPQGEILLKHRKINELAYAQDLYSIGDSLAVVKTPLGTIGLNICADNFPTSHVLAHSLARMGAQILLSPSAWAVDANHDNSDEPYGAMWKQSYATLAKLYDMPVVGVSNVGRLSDGPCRGNKCIGCSLAVGSDGVILTEGPYGEFAEALLVVDIELKSQTARGTSTVEVLSGRGYDGI